jgi:uncharacterized Ntn-hydrolase superfamily protein
MTYSIVARDQKTWDMWVAVQTHWFWVGDNVPWVKAWVWAIATQALTEMRYWYEGIEQLEQWKKPEEVLKMLSDIDEAFQSRQVAMIDNEGNLVSHTGDDCVKHAWSIIWDNFIVQWNILTNDTVLQSMYDSYEQNLHVDFPERLLLSLQAWQDAWWELRWQQSSALFVASGKKWENLKLQLKVDNSKTPILDLKESLKVKQWYDLLMKAEEEWTLWDIDKSLDLFQAAKEKLPGNKEVLFWEASMLYNRGRKEESEEIFKIHFEWESNWKELWNRITW